MRSEQPTRNLKWWQWTLLVPLIPVLILLALLALPLYLLWKICLHLAVWQQWCARGHDILFVYSDSPLWHDHIETCILPRIDERAVVLNWSQRKQWKLSLATMVFHHFGQSREFNPLAVVFRPFHRTRTFRFWRAFHDLKHGRPEPLHAMQQEFFDYVGVSHLSPTD